MSKGRLSRWAVEAVKRGGAPAILVFVFHVIASQGFHAYEHFPLLDIPMHFLGGVVIAFFFHRASLAGSRHGIVEPVDGITHWVLIFALTCAATVFWEFAEFISDRFFGTHAQLGLDDTMATCFSGSAEASLSLSADPSS